MNGSSKVYSAILLALFLIVLMIAILTGTNVYRSIHSSAEQSDEENLSISLIANAIRANDRAGGVSVTDGSDIPAAHAAGISGPVLVMSETTAVNTYELRIYSKDGRVYQEYALAGSDYSQERASEITQSETFDVEISDGIVRVSTDGGQANVALRTLQETL